MALPSGEDLSIRELAETIQRVVGFEGELAFEASKLDDTLRKNVRTAFLALKDYLLIMAIYQEHDGFLIRTHLLV